MKTIVYEKVLHNFNKIVQEKYPNVVGMRVSEMPWRDWWKQCEAAPSGQNTTYSSLYLSSDCFLPNIVYDEFPFLDDLSKTTYLTLCFCNNVNYSALPPVDLVDGISLTVNEDVKTLNISQLQSPLMNMRTDTSAGIYLPSAKNCKITGSIKLDGFRGIISGYLQNNEASFIIPNGKYQSDIEEDLGKNNFIIINEQNHFPFIDANIIELTKPILLLNKDAFVSHFKSKILQPYIIYIPEENKTVFNDGNYEELKLGTLTINGCDPYDVLRTFNGKLSIAQSRPIKESYARLSVEELFKTYGLKYYTQKQKEEAVNSALNERQATASVGGF